MAVATYDATLTTDVSSIWRKEQTSLYQGTKFMTEELQLLEAFKKLPEINYSTREILVPLDLAEGYGTASVTEGGYDAVPSSPAPNELSLSWLDFNQRFPVTKRAKYISEKSKGAMVTDQIKWQTKKAVQAMGRTIGDYMYGYSTAYLAQVDDSGGSLTSDASHTIPIQNGYGNTTVTDAAKLCDFFRVGDIVALISSGALVTNAIGTITAITPATPSITVTWIPGNVDPSDEDYIVLANSMEQTTIAASDYNKGLVGFLDIINSASVHGLATSTNALWATAWNDTAAGRMTGVRLHKARQLIKNAGGGKMDRVLIAQGVERDMIALYQAAARYSSTFGMEVDGSIKSKGVKFFSSERVPPGYVIGYASKSIKKLALLDYPSDSPPWEDADKIQDRRMWAFDIDYPLAMVCTNRGNTFCASGLTEQ